MLIPFESQNVDFVLEFGAQYIRFYKQHQAVISGNTQYEIVSPYSEEDLQTLRYVQNGDYLYLFHKNYPIKTLAMYSETDWRLADFSLKGGPWDSVNTSSTTLSVSAVTGSVTITASANLFSSTDVGRFVRITCTDSTKTAWQAEKSVTSGQIIYSDDKYYEALSTGTTGTYKPVHSEGTISDGAILFKYLHSGYGVARITGYTDAKHVTATVIDRFPDELTSTPSDYWELGMIHKGGEYPICGTFFRNRFCFLVNNDGIPTVCMSNSDDYDNFTDKEHGEVLATNAITVPLVSDRRNEPCWLTSASVLFVGTSSAEFYIDSAASSEALAPDNVKSQKISEIGSLPITPVKIGVHTLFVTKSGTSIRDIIYSYENDAYDPIDLSFYGRHLIQSGIVAMKYQEYPDKIVWLAVNDGRLIGVTFSSEQRVIAVHQHYLGGDIKDLTTIHDYDNSLGELWLEITRHINGDDKTSVEWVDNGYPVIYQIFNTDDVDEKENLEADYMKANSYYVDGGIVVERTPDPNLSDDTNVTINGLQHLEGVEVAIMADGAEMVRQTVTNKSITVPNKCKNIRIGIPLDSIYIPQTMYIQGGSGSGVGDVQRIDHLTFMLWRSLGGQVGEKMSSLQTLYFRDTDETMGESVSLFTGNKTVPVNFNNSKIKDKGAKVIIRNDSVFPMNILAIAPHFSTSGNGL